MKKHFLLAFCFVSTLVSCNKVEDTSLSTNSNQQLEQNLLNTKWSLTNSETRSFITTITTEGSSVEETTSQNINVYNGIDFRQINIVESIQPAIAPQTTTAIYVRTLEETLEFQPNGILEKYYKIHTTEIRDEYEDADTSYSNIRNSVDQSLEYTEIASWYVTSSDNGSSTLFIDNQANSNFDLTEETLTFSEEDSYLQERINGNVTIVTDYLQTSFTNYIKVK